MNVDLQALIIPVLILGLLVMVTRWATRRPRPPAARRADLDVIAVNLSRPKAMELRATLGEAGIQTSMLPRTNGAAGVLVLHRDVNARTVLHR